MKKPPVLKRWLVQVLMEINHRTPSRSREPTVYTPPRANEQLSHPVNQVANNSAGNAQTAADQGG